MTRIHTDSLTSNEFGTRTSKTRRPPLSATSTSRTGPNRNPLYEEHVAPLHSGAWAGQTLHTVVWKGRRRFLRRGNEVLSSLYRSCTPPPPPPASFEAFPISSVAGSSLVSGSGFALNCNSRLLNFFSNPTFCEQSDFLCLGEGVFVCNHFDTAKNKQNLLAAVAWMYVP